MTVVFDIVLPILAGISIVAVVLFLLRAVSARSRVENQAYEVGRVETRQRAQVNLLRAFVALIFAVFFLALIALGPQLKAFVPAPTVTPPPTVMSPTTTSPATVTLTPVPATAEATTTPLVPTATPTLPPTETPTPEPLKATVTSGVGVYLRNDPGVGAAELEYLPDGTVLLVLDGQQAADDLQWQQVQTDNGQIGWVALEFITINEP